MVFVLFAFSHVNLSHKRMELEFCCRILIPSLEFFTPYLASYSSRFIMQNEMGVVMHACIPSTCEAETRGLPQVLGQSGLQSEFEASLSYINKQ